MTPTEATRRLSMLEAMLLIRAYEEALAARATPTRPGTCTSVGQEAAAVGVVRALEARDRILTNHRSAGHLIARGADIGRLMAEVLGRTDGYCKGKSGSLHISAAELGVVLTSTIVGGELSLAPGVALAQKMGQGEAGAVTAVFFGDGAACEGIFHEAINLAVAWQLPLLFVCENNQWQAFVARRETMPADPPSAAGLAGGRIAAWAAGHGLPTTVLDGNDVEAVHAAALDAVAQIRTGSGPRFLELVTYRQRGHFEPDDQAYVDPAELAAWKGRDPIARAADRLLAEKVIGPAELAHFRDRAAATIAAALQFAESSPWPDPRELTTDVYA
ncbi:MAG TPA: thiamine pyrophosphate-dependent dehydrogenase E1 component subunit alpha [Caldimonas sp.]|jgi:pyruvate dehydrogenase E1 component alpha subunit|nr:thiamine pyrophosphate-dependent dehydrogenase E1 component subunit alpha [Caldimonas sp.]HEX2539914.1 thiamine pyrophosphate-dependent dehydrogenase E1 component subunit alpha [Caldimonas sp.]